MARDTAYFFCGIGGSGMLPLALILQAKGHAVSGSDRALDQGRTGQKFDFLRARGMPLFPQDGSGVTRPDLIVVTSAAIEDTVPDVQAAHRIGARTMTRAALLAEMFNAATLGIGVAGTSGKSTTTGMLGWILHRTGRQPTIMNGAVMKNFITPDVPFASAVVGSGSVFLSEVDESDGSIVQYRPRIAVLNNISADHKPLPELKVLFRDFVAKSQTAVLNLDNADTPRSPRTCPRAGSSRTVSPMRSRICSVPISRPRPTASRSGRLSEAAAREHPSGSACPAATTSPTRWRRSRPRAPRASALPRRRMRSRTSRAFAGGSRWSAARTASR